MKKYYNAIVGVAIVGVFVLGLTISGSASNILASISDAVGGQQAQVTAPTCVLSRDLTTGSTGEDVRVLQKFLNRLGYTLTTVGNPGSPGLEYEKFNSLANNTGVPLSLYQSEYGIIPADGVLKSLSRSSINPKLTSADCAPNSPYYFKYFLGPQTTYAPNQNISVVLAGEEKIDKTDLKSAEGFNVQAHLYKKSTNRVTSLSSAQRLTANPAGSYNGRFNTQLNQWEVNMLSPVIPGDYFLRVVIYCSKSGSYCANKYGIGGEVRQVVPIKVDGTISTAPRIELVSTDASVNIGDSTNDDAGTFTIKFKVTAGVNAIYVSSLADSRISGVTTGKTSVLIDRAGVAVTGGVSVALDNITDWSLNRAGLYTIKAGESETFELTSAVQMPAAGTFGPYRATLGGLSWGTSSTDSTPNNAISNLSTFRTQYVVLN